MENEQNERLIAWLNDARAMETALIPILEQHARETAEGCPAMKVRLERHVEETRRQAARLKDCIQRLGGKIEPAGDLAPLLDALQIRTKGILSDEPMRNAILDFAIENFESACYQCIVQAAEELGHLDIAAACRDILLEEEEMARWIEGQFPAVVREASKPVPVTS